MKTYISLLRGINVSGKNLIKMEVLRQIYTDLGCKKVLTYVQSGNVVFLHPEVNPKDLEKKISDSIYSKSGLKMPVMVFTLDEWVMFIKNNPLHDNNPSFLHITFLSEEVKSIDIEVIKDKREEGEEVSFVGRCFYLYCPFGYGNTKLTNNFIESKCKVSATTRNWKTVNELQGLAQSIESEF